MSTSAPIFLGANCLRIFDFLAKTIVENIFIFFLISIFKMKGCRDKFFVF